MWQSVTLRAQISDARSPENSDSQIIWLHFARVLTKRPHGKRSSKTDSTLTARSKPYNRGRFLRARDGCTADRYGTRKNSSWTNLCQFGSTRGRKVAVDWPCSGTVCGSAEDAVVDSRKPCRVRGPIICASSDCSWKGQCRGNETGVSCGMAVSSAQPLRGHKSVANTRGRACTVKNRWVTRRLIARRPVPVMALLNGQASCP